MTKHNILNVQVSTFAEDEEQPIDNDGYSSPTLRRKSVGFSRPKHRVRNTISPMILSRFCDPFCVFKLCRITKLEGTTASL